MSRLDQTRKAVVQEQIDAIVAKRQLEADVRRQLKQRECVPSESIDRIRSHTDLGLYPLNNWWLAGYEGDHAHIRVGQAAVEGAA